MERSKHATVDLETTREALAIWRRRHGGRGRRIPTALWDEARELAREHGVAETARVLRLDAVRLAKLVAPSNVEPASFVELGSLQLGVGSDAAVVELFGRDGERVRVELVASAVDLVALASALWSRRP